MRRTGRRKKNSAHGQDLFHITDAPKPLTQDIRSREQKYLMAMGIRVVAFVLIVVLPVHWGWKIGLIALALVLPYVAVVYANGGREPVGGATDQYQDPVRQALATGRAEITETAEGPLSGTVVDDVDPPEQPEDYQDSVIQPRGDRDGDRDGDPHHTPEP